MRHERRHPRRRRRAGRRVLRARARPRRGDGHTPREGARDLPAGERGARQLRAAGAERRHAPGRPRRARPGAALDARQLQPVLHRAAAEPGAGALAVAVPGRLLGGAGAGGRSRRCARCTWRARACTTSSPQTRGEEWLFHHDGELQVFETAAGLAAAAEDVERARALGARVEEVTADGRPASVPRPSLRTRRRVLLPRGRPPRPPALHARGGRAGGGGRRDRGDGRRGARARAGAGGRAGRDHAGRVQPRVRWCWPPAPGRRSSRAGSACACRSSRPRATASTSSGRPASPSCRSTWATPTWCSRRSATRCAWEARSSSPAGTCASGRGVSRTCGRAASAPSACRRTARCVRSGAARVRSLPTASR